MTRALMLALALGLAGCDIAAAQREYATPGGTAVRCRRATLEGLPCVVCDRTGDPRTLAVSCDWRSDGR